MKIKIPTFKERQRLIQNDRAAKALAVNGGPGSGPQGGRNADQASKDAESKGTEAAHRIARALHMDAASASMSQSRNSKNKADAAAYKDDAYSHIAMANYHSDQIKSGNLK